MKRNIIWLLSLLCITSQLFAGTPAGLIKKLQQAKLPQPMDFLQVLSAKGKYYVVSQGNFYLFRQKYNYENVGTESDSTAGAIYEFIPSTAILKKITDIPFIKCFYGVAFLNNKIYIAGGFNTRFTPTSQVYEFDLASKGWTTKSPMLNNRARMAFKMVGGKIYALYGAGGKGTCEVYEPEKNTWGLINFRVIPTGLKPVNDVTASAVVENRIFLVTPYVTEFYEYDILGNTMSERTLPPFKSDYFDMYSINKKIYVAGGSNANEIDDVVYKFDPYEGMWQNTGRINVPRCRSGLLYYGSMLMFMGGSLTDASKNTKLTDEIFIYIPTK